MVTFKNPARPLVPTDLDEVEKRFGFTFPQEFRDHYLQLNGGRPDKDRYFVDDKGTCIPVGEFLPIKYGKPGLTLEFSIQMVKVDQSLLPEHLVPFAVDPFGDFYCFSTQEDDLGAIFVFRMDHYDNPQRATKRLASSLSSFLNSLTTKKDAPKKP